MFGKPCVASNAGAIPEAGRGAAVLLDPDDVASWTAMISRYSFDRESLAEATAAVGKHFRPRGWRDTACVVREQLNAHVDLRISAAR
jgi:hypothetical protein